MTYTIDQLLAMDFETVSDNDLTNILEFVDTHYFELMLQLPATSTEL